MTDVLGQMRDLLASALANGDRPDHFIVDDLCGWDVQVQLETIGVAKLPWPRLRASYEGIPVVEDRDGVAAAEARFDMQPAQRVYLLVEDPQPTESA